MADINELRAEIEKIDSDMIELFKKRMKISSEIAEYKRQNNIQVLDKNREKVLIEKNLAVLNDKELEEYYTEFFEGMLKASKDYQKSKLEKK